MEADLKKKLLAWLVYVRRARLFIIYAIDIFYSWNTIFFLQRVVCQTLLNTIFVSSNAFYRLLLRKKKTCPWACYGYTIIHVKCWCKVCFFQTWNWDVFIYQSKLVVCRIKTNLASSSVILSANKNSVLRSN